MRGELAEVSMLLLEVLNHSEKRVLVTVNRYLGTQYRD